MSIKFGYFMLTLGIFFLSLSRIITKGIFSTLHPCVVGFFIFTFAQIVFIIPNIKTLKQVKFFLLIKDSIWYVILFNIVSIGSWFGPLYPIKYISPTLTSCIITSATPFLSMVCNYVIRNKSFQTIEWINVTILFVISLSISTYISLYQEQGIYLFFWLIFSSISLAGISILVKKMYNLGFTMSESLVLRFILTVIITGIIYNYNYSNININIQDFISLVFIAVIYIILPTYLIQLSAKFVSSISIALFFSFIPIMVFILEKTFLSVEISISNLEFTFIIISTTMTFIGAYYRYRKETEI